jgi:hypothetical protein
MELKNMSSRFALTVEVIQSGGSGDTVELSLEDMLKQAREFPEIAKDNPVTISVITNEYINSVPVPLDIQKPDSLPMRRRRETLEDLGKEYLKLRDYKSSLQFVLEHLIQFDQFKNLDPDQLEQERLKYMAELQATAKEIWPAAGLVDTPLR